MTAAEGSFLGLAKQTAKGTPNTTDASFKYFLFNEGSFGVNSNILPLDPEVGGGALVRDVNKVGVTSSGVLTFIPRPQTLGDLLLGLLPNDTVTDNADGSYDHVFDLGNDPFDAPYYTYRNAPGDLFGEQYQDCRVASLQLNWRGANYLRGQLGILGGLPTKVVTTTWSALTYLDSGPQFLAPLSTIELPTSTSAKVLSGSFAIAANIPLDEQWIVGSYSPDGFDITGKSVVISMVVKVEDDTLYKKMAYDPAGGTAWVADIFKEADFNITFASNVEAASGTPYSLNIAANGQTAASGDANVAWSVSPIAMRAGSNLLMSVQGTFLASPNASFEPIEITLVNQEASY